MFNLKKIKYFMPSLDRAYIFKGILVYKNGGNLIIGGATVSYDSRNNSLAICATDSIADKGQIIYNAKVPSDSYYFYGIYHYHKRAEECDTIYMKLIKGYFPNTNPQPSLSKEAIFQEPKNRLPKWER
jgi:hypothetical protein